MSEDTLDRDEVFDFLAEERRDRRDPEEHPSPETLTAYQANELSPEEDERIQDHLVQCRHCTEMLLELEEFLQPAEAEPASEPEAPHRLQEPPLALTDTAYTAYRSPLMLPLAASVIGVLILLVGYSSWWGLHQKQVAELKKLEVTKLQHQVAELQQPVVSPPSLLLRSVRGEEGALAVPAGRAVWLTFDTPVPDDYSEYRAQIMDEEGKVRWAGALSKDKEGKLPLLLINGYLEPGEYVVRLIGAHKEGLDLLQENRIRVPSGSPRSQGR